MADVHALEYRNVVVVGKPSEGKSSVANKVLGLQKFKVTNTARRVASDVEARCSTFYNESSRTPYIFKVIDTVGILGTTSQDDTEIVKVKKFFQNFSPEGINLVLFVLRKGRFTDQDRRAFEYFIKHFSDEISDFSALVFTFCDGESDAANQKFLDTFKTAAKDIVLFMKQGIYMVAFPQLYNMKQHIVEAMEEDITEQAKMLQKVMMKADKRCPGNEMFRPT